MLKSIKVRLYLNKEQPHKVNSIMGSCRFVYNQDLSVDSNVRLNQELVCNINDTLYYKNYNGKLNIKF